MSLRAGDFEAAQSIADVTHSGMASAMGPLVTYLLIVVGLWMLHRYESVLGAALAVGAAARVSVLLSAMTGDSAGSDEAGVSRALLVPEMPLHAVGFIVCAGGVIGCVVLLRRQGRARLVPSPGSTCLAARGSARHSPHAAATQRG